MDGKPFNKKDIAEIRETAIKIYTHENPGASAQDLLRIEVIALATYNILKKKGLINESAASESGNKG
jgi:hypothetical protein